MNTQEKLNRLAELQAQVDAIRLHYEELRTSIIPAEIREQLAEIDAEASTEQQAASAGIDALTAEIKADVIAGGATVKADHLQAVYAKGRVSWDTKALDGYAAGHPEIAPFRKEGEPSVSIRKV
jgi:hypothetical protein